MAQISKMRIINASDAPPRTFYDEDMKFDELNELNKLGRKFDETPEEIEDMVFSFATEDEKDAF
jgi:hypothetical protein